MNLTQEAMSELEDQFKVADLTSDMAKGNEKEFEEIDLEESVRDRARLEAQLDAGQELHNDDVYTQDQIGSKNETTKETNEQISEQAQQTQQQTNQNTEQNQQTQQGDIQTIEQVAEKSGLTTEQILETTVKVGENDIKISQLAQAGLNAGALQEKNQLFQQGLSDLNVRIKEYEDTNNKEYMSSVAIIEDLIANVDENLGGTNLAELRRTDTNKYLQRKDELDEMKKGLDKIKTTTQEKYDGIVEKKNKEYYDLHNGQISRVYGNNQELIKKAVEVLESAGIKQEEDIKFYDSRMFGFIAELVYLREQFANFKKEKKEVVTDQGNQNKTVRGQQSRQTQQGQQGQRRAVNAEDDLMSTIEANI